VDRANGPRKSAGPDFGGTAQVREAGGGFQVCARDRLEAIDDLTVATGLMRRHARTSQMAGVFTQRSNEVVEVNQWYRVLAPAGDTSL